MTRLLVGIDAAANMAKCGYSMGALTAERIDILEAGLLDGSCDESTALERVASRIASSGSALIAIDAPLGWPASLGHTMMHHSAGQHLIPRRGLLFRRRTDESVREKTGKIPLDVGAEKIAHAAHHALDILERLRVLTNSTIPLAWSPGQGGAAAIEVYPAATLRSRVKEKGGYRKDTAEDRAVRAGIAEAVAHEVPQLREYVSGSVDVFDACVCLLAAKDFLADVCTPPDDLETAKKEGWIWVKPAAESARR